MVRPFPGAVRSRSCASRISAGALSMARGNSFSRYAGTKVDYHYHEFCKLLLLVSGRGGYVVDGQRYLLQTGDVVLIGSRSAHRPELEEDSAYERIIIYISPEFLQRASTEGCDLMELFSAKHGSQHKNR